MKMSDRIQELEQVVRDDTVRIRRLNEEVGELKDNNDDLKHQLAGSMLDIIQLRELQVIWQQDNFDLCKTNDTLTADVEEAESMMENMHGNFKDLLDITNRDHTNHVALKSNPIVRFLMFCKNVGR